MSPLLGSIGGISEYNYRGTLDDWPNPFAFGSLINVIPGTIVGISTVITGINYKASVSASGNAQISVRNVIGITSIYSGNSNIPSNTVTVSIAKSTTELNVGANIRISNTSNVDYNGEFLINSIIDSPYVTQFTYIVPQIPSTARPGITTATFDHQVYPFVASQLVYIRNNQILEVKIPTASGSELDFDKQYSTTVRVGKRSASWSVRTREKDNSPNPFFFNNVSGLNIEIATTSNSITISGLESGFSSYARISSGIGSFSVNGSVGLSTANVTNGDLIYMNEISSENYFTPKTSFLTVGTYTTSFTVTTRASDIIPNQFYFNSLVNVPINQDQVSISTSLTGTDNNIPLTAVVSTPGTLKVNGDVYISGSTEVFSGDTVTLKIPANVLNSYQTKYSTQLTVSGISSAFSVTTRPRPIKTFPSQFIFADLINVAPSTYVESSVVTLTGMTVGIADTGLATISGGSEFKVTRNGSLIRAYSATQFAVRNSDQIQLKVLSAGEGSSFQSTFTISGVDTTDDINGINGFTADIWNVSSRLLSCKINETSFRAALVSVVNAAIRELKSISFSVSGLDNGCDTVITTSNPDSYIRNRNGIQVSSLQPLDIKNGDVITIYMTAASTYSTNKITTIETKRRDGSDLVSGTWTIGTQVEDKLPDPFNLPTRNQNNVSPCTFRSTFVTESLSGLSQETVVAATVSSTNLTAEISKNNGIFGTSISGGVRNGDRIDVRLKSNCNYGGPCEIATVAVGERTEQWTICPENVPLPTVTLSSNATNIQYNGSLTLTWTSTFATSVTSSIGTGFVGIGSTQGTITIPNLKTGDKYLITVGNLRGSASSSINITVAAEPSPTVTLTASPSTILYNGSSTLTWTSTNATAVVSTTGIDFTNITTTSGNKLILSIIQNRNYSITVKNASGVTASSSASIFYTTPPTPTVILTASTPTTINSGGSITLSWSSTNATSVSSYTGFGFVPGSTTGTLTINNITQNTSYTLTVSGPGGTITSNTINLTLNLPTVSLTALPKTVNYGGSITLTWSSTNATSVSSSNFGASSVGGSLVVANLTTPSSSNSTETYTITVTGPGGSSTASANVTILPPGPTVLLTANPTLVPYGGSTILTWTSANAITLTSNFGATSLNGSTTITNVIANKRYTVTVSSASGAIATSFVDIVAGSPPPTVNLCATNIGDGLLPISQDCGPTKLVGYGAQVRLEWSSTNATSVLSTSGQSFSGITATNGSFILPYSLKTPGTYSITVSGSGGTATDSITITPSECNGNIFLDSFALYKLAFVNFNNATNASRILFTSTKTTASLPGRPNYSYALMHEFIYDSYRTIINRSPEKEGLEFYINAFITNKSTYRTLSELYGFMNDLAAPELSDRAARGGLKSITDTCDKIWDTSTPLPAPTRCTNTLITDSVSNATYRNGFIVVGNGVDQIIQPFFVSTINPSLTLPNRPEFTYDQVHSYIKSIYNAPTTATSGLSRPPEKDGFVYYVSEFQIKLLNGTYKYTTLNDLGVAMNAVRTTELNTRNQNGGFVATVDTCGKIWSY